MLLPQKDLVQRNNHLVISQMQRKKKKYLFVFIDFSAADKTLPSKKTEKK
jgi:hypothetical protein